MAGTGKAHLRNTDDVLLRVEDLVVEFPIGRTGLKVNAVSGISFDVLIGETLGIVGESGCGKSTTGRAIMQLPSPTSGSNVFNGTDLTALSGEAMREARTKIQMIFQDPISSLNPRRNVRDIVLEPLSIWNRGTKAEQLATVDKILEHVGIDPERAAESKPHQFSGGQCQRISIARSLVLNPQMIICEDLYRNPAHPYTDVLLSAIPVPDPTVAVKKISVEGEPPSPVSPPAGCRFNTRCPNATDRCRSEEPTLREIEPSHFVACHHPLVGGEAPVTVRSN